MESRLPAHLEAGALIHAVHQAGGFATVIQKGERDAGTLLLILVENGRNARLYERMPMLDGSRKWHCVNNEDIENKQVFSDYIALRRAQDRDTWIIELDIVNGERFIGEAGDIG